MKMLWTVLVLICLAPLIFASSCNIDPSNGTQDDYAVCHWTNSTEELPFEASKFFQATRSFKRTTLFDTSCNKNTGIDCRSSNDQCNATIAFSECWNDFCHCHEDRHYVRSEKQCRVTRRYNETCGNDLDCACHPRSEMFCDISSGRYRCNCKESSRPSEDQLFCIQKQARLHTMCDLHEDCGTFHSLCKDNLCQCQQNYIPYKEFCVVKETKFKGSSGIARASWLLMSSLTLVAGTIELA
ncbi:uncharacterized protein LOC111693525 [Trichogramma pretiosum]|uniref:uncharacterized protein LOC111693525 n=1 Tax=Trichogramma pretiosum TaxID=7493 RepID=UPI000C71BA22|nr:uncharacterized protein LOC111693525 [Trichogramma pretiosum]